MSGSTGVETKVEIEQVIAKLGKSPNDLDSLCRLACLYLDDNKLSKSKPHADHALALFKKSKSITVKQGVDVADMLVKFWKCEKFVNKADLRIVLSEERNQVLNSAEDVLKTVIAKKDSEYGQLLSLKMAFVKESRGEFQPALALLSDLIAIQATNQVDLSFIIFKAAVLLKHVGQPKQCIEYLEFIMDDPPVQDGYTRTHVAAFLTHTYEQSGDKYKVFLPKAYKDLQEAFAADMPAASQKLIRSLGKGNNFSQSCELWEILALQALDRCDYILAVEFLSQAIAKAPGKGKLLHVLAEVYTLLKQKDKAIACAEEAYSVMPQSSELRNLLLQIAPKVWTEKLRQMAPTTSIAQEEQEELPGAYVEDPYAPPSPHKPHVEPPENMIIHKNSTGHEVFLSAEKEIAAEEANNSNTWLSKMKNKASDALKAINSGTPLLNPKSPGAAKDEKEDDHLPHNRPKSPEHNLVKAGAGAEAEAVSPAGDKEKVSKAGTESESKASQEKKGIEKGKPAKEATPLPADSETSQQKQESVQSDKTAAPMVSPVSVHAPASAHSPASAEPEAAESRSLSRPKSRSSFVNMLYSTASAAAAATSSVASSVSTAATATVHSISNKSPMKSRPPSANGETSTLGRFLSPSRNAPTGSSKKGGGVNTSAKMTSSAKAKKDTKYDLNVHKSKLLVRDERQIVRRPVKPQLTREDRKIMDLILSGNENVHVYDPNLQVLHDYRMSHKSNK